LPASSVIRDRAQRDCPPSRCRALARAIADDALLRRLRTIHAVSRGTYGAPRVHAELRAEGRAVGKKRVARLMRAAGIVGVSRRRGVITTRRDRDARPAPDLVDRNFTANRPNQLWVADITYVPTAAGRTSRRRPAFYTSPSCRCSRKPKRPKEPLQKLSANDRDMMRSGDALMRRGWGHEVADAGDGGI
jgi:hypothetical protein